MFLAGGAVAGYLGAQIFPNILHHANNTIGPAAPPILFPCAPENLARSVAGTTFCCGSPTVDGFCYDTP
jgi:hypothetical protein